MQLKHSKNDWYSNIQFVKLFESDWLDNQRHAGRVVAKCLQHCRNIIENEEGFTTNYLNEECAKIIKENDCQATFFGYKGFPGSICTSVNTELVHGIPSDKIVKEGDVVKVDLGATYQGAIADAATTVFCKRSKSKDHERISRYCKEALDKAISSIKLGKQVGVIGHTIAKHVQLSGGHLITNYGGHGISEKPHDHPFVANKARYNEGVRFQPGMVLAIEPMLSLKSNKTRVLSDGWTVVTSGINAHHEHTVVILDDSVEVITKCQD